MSIFNQNSNFFKLKHIFKIKTYFKNVKNNYFETSFNRILIRALERYLCQFSEKYQ